MTTVLTPRPILRHLKDRLRQNYVDDAQYDDAEVLALLNDAYRDACEQSRCLETLATFTLISGQVEYALPADYSSTLAVYANGIELESIPLAGAFSSVAATGNNVGGYYLYATTIGFWITAAMTSTVKMIYAAYPAALASFDSTLDSRFPEEFADILVHYVRWRVQMLSGGAERITQARWDRQLYDLRIKELRRRNNIAAGTGNFRIGHVGDRRRSDVA